MAYCYSTPIGEQSIVMSVSECVSVCLSVHDHIFGIIRPIFSKFLMHVAYGRCSILFWWRSDTLCTSSFMDDVIFARKPVLLDVAAVRLTHAALGLAHRNTHCRQQTLGITSCSMGLLGRSGLAEYL